MPIEFVLFGLTLTGVAVFHHHTLYVTLGGLTAIVGYQLFFSSFPEVPDSPHWRHTWSMSG